MSRATPAAAARAAMPERYGRPRPGRRFALLAVVAAVAVAALCWLVWAASGHSTPDVSGGVSGFEVVSDARTDVTLEVHRRVEAAVRCEVYAQAEDKAIVGERSVLLDLAPPGAVSVTVPIATERRATTAVVRTCIVD